MSDSLQPHGLQHARPPCPSPTPRLYSNSCPLSQWCHPTISSSVVPFSSHLQSFPESGSFQISQFFVTGGQSIRVLASASVYVPTNSYHHARLSPRSSNNVGFLKLGRGRGAGKPHSTPKDLREGPQPLPQPNRRAPVHSPSPSFLGRPQEADTRDQEAWSYSERPQMIQGWEHAEKKENLLEQGMRVSSPLRPRFMASSWLCFRWSEV